MSQAGLINLTTALAGTIETINTIGPDSNHNFTINAGTGISITPGTNSITVASSGVVTINGDSGSVTGNTLTLTGGTNGGFFTGSGTTLTESFNYLNLPATDISSNGTIQLNGTQFVSFYASGVNNENVCIGRSVNHVISSGAGNNVYIGNNIAASAIATSANVVLGSDCLTVATTANSNIGLGASVFGLLTTGGLNVGICGGALENLTTGNFNIAIGSLAGQSYTSSESNNILLMNTGVASESNVMRLGTTGSGSRNVNKTYIAGITGTTPTSANTPQVTVCDSQGNISVLSSSTSGYVLTSNGTATPSFQAVSASGAITTINGDSGSATPTAGAVTFTGYPLTVGNIKGVKTTASGSTVEFASLTATTPYVVGSDANTAVFTSIQTAINQAVSDGASSSTPAVVWIHAGTYTENLTLHPYVDLAGASDPSTETGVLIVGNAIYPNPSTGNFSLTNVGFKTNNTSAALSFQSTGTSTVHLQSVSIDGNTGIGLECTGSGMTLQSSIGSIVAGTGGKCKNVSSGYLEFFSGISTFTDTASTVSGGVLRIVSCDITDSFSVTGGELQCLSSIIDGTTLECVTLGASGLCVMTGCILGSTAVSGYLISGSGTLLYGSITTSGTNTLIQNTVTASTFTTLTGNLSFNGGTSTLSSDGQLWIGSGSGNPTPANLTAGTGISVTNGAGSITLSATGGGLTWSVVTGTTQAAAVNNGYIANNAGLVTVTLPATSAVGDEITVTGINNATGWKIAQNAGNQIFFGSASTTSGTGGSLASSATRDTVTLVCMTANATWNVISSVGNITVV